MTLITVKGLVIRTVDIKESDRLVTIFTEERGVISAMAKGARSLKSRQMSSTMQYCYGTFVLCRKNDLFWIREAELIESFFNLRRSIEGMSLAAYVCEVLSEVTVEEAERDLLRLSLNSLYAIAERQYEIDKIKAAFEIRCCSIIGFMPDVLGCRACGAKDGDFILDVMDGTLLCAACRDGYAGVRDALSDVGERRVICLLSPTAKVAFGYCVYSPIEKIFSFRIPAEDMSLLSQAAETYLLHHLGRPFKTLDFYKEIKG